MWEMWEAEAWQGRGGRVPHPTADLEQEDLGVAMQCLAAAQFLHQRFCLYFFTTSPQWLPLWPPMGHQGHQGTAHGGHCECPSFPEAEPVLPRRHGVVKVKV